MTDPTKRTLSDEEYVAEKVKRYQEYREKLDEYYWPNFKVNKEMYAGYDPKNPTRYQTNTARGIVESTLNKVMTANRKVGADIHGPEAALNRKIEQTLESLANSIFDDKKITKRHGSYRANKEKLVRDLLTIGNCVGEKNYEYITTVREDGSLKVVSDGVYLSPLTYDQYVFNPAYSWNTSPEKFIVKGVSGEYIMENLYKTWTEEEEGEPVKVKKSSGIFKIKNVKEFEEQMKIKGKLVEMDHDGNSFQAFTGTTALAPRWVEDLELLVCWDGCQLDCILEGSELIRDEYDPFGTGTDNITTAMLVEETGRPVAWGIIDHIRGLVQIKDDSLNTRKALLERALKIGGLYDDTDKAKLWMVGQVILKGGVAPGQGSKWQEINTINPSIANALLSPAEIQGEIERASLYSPYDSGQPNSATDKTNGTATGIKTISQAAAPNSEVVLEKVQEQIDTPFLDFSLITMANAKDDDDIRWIMKSGGSSESVAITRRFLQGRPMIDDLIMAGILNEEDAQKLLEQNPDRAQAPYVDEDLLIFVTLDPSNASDKYEKAQAEKALVDELVQLQQPVNVQKAYTTIAEKMGFEDFAEIFYSPEEVQQQQMQSQQAQEAQMMQQQESATTDHQRKMELMQASQMHEAALASAQNDMTLAQSLQNAAY